MKRAVCCILLIGFIAILAGKPDFAAAQQTGNSLNSGASLQVRYELFATVSMTGPEDSAVQRPHQIRSPKKHRHPTLTGFEKMHIKNKGSLPVSQIQVSLYPNSYSSDSSMLSEQLLEKGDLRLYFAGPDALGRITQLNFSLNGQPLVLQDPAMLADNAETCVLLLPAPLAPNDSILIQTPFLLELPQRILDLGYDPEDYTCYLKDWFPQVMNAGNTKEAEDLNASVWARLHILGSEDTRCWVNGNLQAPVSGDNPVGDTHPMVTRRFELVSGPHATMILSSAANASPLTEKSVATPGVDRSAGDYFKKLLPSRLLAAKRPDRPDSLMRQMIAARRGEYPYTGAPNKKLTPAFLFNLKEADTKKYLSFSPALGFNDYDQWMPGILIHNYGLPVSGFNFLAAPLYSTGSHSISGIGRLSYTKRHPGSAWQISIDGSDYAFNQFSSWTDGAGGFHQGGRMRLLRIVPAVRYKWTPRGVGPIGETDAGTHSAKSWSITAKSYILRTDSVMESSKKPAMGAKTTTIGELSVALTDDRALYPYRLALKLQGTDQFLRAGLTGNYFLNYDANGNGLQLRGFAGKFFYLNKKNNLSSFYLQNYFFNLSGGTGIQDFTYSDYFIGRSDYNGWMSQQMAVSDGFFKVSTPFLLNPVGQSDNWLAAINLTTDLPDGINPFSVLPFRLPLRVFADFGTYGDLWSETPPAGRFLYDAGVQVSVLKEAVTIYLPLLYSKIYRETYNSIGELGRFAKRIRFSVSLENLLPKRLHKDFKW